MSRVPQAHYYVPGRERPQRSRVSRIKFPLLTLLVLAGASYCVYVYRQQIPSAPLASATADTSVVAQQPVAPTVSPVSSDIQKVEPATVVLPDLSAILTRTGLSQNRASTWSVAVYDITNKRWIAQVNPDQQIFSASLYKLYVVYGLSKTLPFDQWSSKQVAGHSVKDCVDLMLRMSDNTCALAVGDMVGWNKVDKEANKYGFTRTDMAKTGGSVTTATETTTFMSDLYQGKLLGADATTFVLNSLKNQTFRSGIPAGCTGCTVYNKTGNESGVAHDAAIVQDGKYTYAITVMSEGGSSYKIANIERSLETALKAAH